MSDSTPYAAGGSIEQQQRRVAVFLQTADIVIVHHSGTGIRGTHFVGKKGNLPFLPMDQIRTDSMSPGHIAPAGIRRIVLEEHMILPLVEDAAIGVIEPAATGGEVGCRAEALTIMAVSRVEKSKTS